MPRRQPFTALCQALSRPHRRTDFQSVPAVGRIGNPSYVRGSGRADLHVHTTHSDGTYTPAQVVELARRSGLAAVAVTDHDTLSGVADAQAAAAGSGLEVVPGVEISCEHHGRELHLLGYFVRTGDAAL